MTTIRASDGVCLAVHRYGESDPKLPTVLAVHGYPDNHRIWDGVARQLAGRCNVFAYDVRGAGESSCPTSRSGYRLTQLVSDMGAVIDSLDADRVHLLGHDWGSVQGWAAITDASLAGRIASFTSISGPHLPYAGRFVRSARTPRAALSVARQVLCSAYLAFLLCPGVPELAFRSGIAVKVVAALERIGQSGGIRGHAPRGIADYVNGLELYRANLPGPLLSPGPAPAQTPVAVQVLVPRKDIFITPALQRYLGAIPRRGRVVPVEGGHWAVTSHPREIARLTADWVDQVSAGFEPSDEAANEAADTAGNAATDVAADLPK
ncbi:MULTISPECIES: alpha/beta fold hydrolase [Mycobacterium]|uniref:AB hydrolase-1 domain-containing protein n=1 Tax=Mycobacterium kiyosense TaxID=2871094 RepID=A0A9P3Q490_9MYCO|nr:MULTISPECIES: alpha/beta fold hydrolase [Mycobacterium]BDE13380.1 hypothetical protein MKCMC460_22400 [Mycobacterium sp. 20KCMC460]GLB86334.1 hypothetical protein SRL2020028_55900 [Mycobacterium kiyosense]GLB92283.1 hypothetical protein SRL2020130_51000 [Mycobacterium kiyosense]GLB98267.1 hypothetical protein SRL2020226_50430 [Mycobacterium kiyosense]GLC01393.1 hypothetical protein SRL2020400_19840 [Mycobacterium kiyosense]